MKKIIEYIVLGSNGDGNITQIINDFIMRGWQPFGSPFPDSAFNIYQAMVKYED